MASDLASELFASQRATSAAEDRLGDALTAAGIDHEDFWYDHYDISIEIKSSTLAELSIAQREVIGALGFIQCWLHGTAGEKHYGIVKT